MILSMLDRVNGKTGVIAGAWVLSLLLAFAAGNGHKTQEALKGQAVYFQTQEKKHVNIVADKVAKTVRHEDAKAIGVPDPVLKHAVDADKTAAAH